MIRLFKMALRDVGRNRRRSFFSSLALGMGLGLLLLMAGFIHGEMNSAVQTGIRLQTGHLQIRAASYDEVKSSLKWADLVANPAHVASQVAALPQVLTATPRLIATGFIAQGNQSTGVRILGVDPASPANDPFSKNMTGGVFLAPDDRDGIVIGKPLAEKMNLKTGDSLTLSANTSNGDVAEQAFTVRGIYNTETNAFDSATVFLSLSKAQAFTQAGDHASTIYVVLKNLDQADAVAAALASPSYSILTWQKMNQMILEYENLANSYMIFMYLIVLGVTATVIVNTLIMAVFERTREIGILTAIGMKSWRIMAMFLAESAMLAFGGIIMGLALGFLLNFIFATFGIDISKMGVSGVLFSNKIYTDLTIKDTVNLTITALVVTLLAGLYPALMAARMQPVEALRGGK
jgi:ABC-type lipoprotein release transport system permease subunit